MLVSCFDSTIVLAIRIRTIGAALLLIERAKSNILLQKCQKTTTWFAPLSKWFEVYAGLFHDVFLFLQPKSKHLDCDMTLTKQLECQPYLRKFFDEVKLRILHDIFTRKWNSTYGV